MGQPAERADGFTHKGPLAAGLVIELVSVAMLAWTMQDITLGAGYAAWAGVGTFGAVVEGSPCTESLWRLHGSRSSPCSSAGS